MPVVDKVVLELLMTTFTAWCCDIAKMAYFQRPNPDEFLSLLKFHLYVGNKLTLALVVTDKLSPAFFEGFNGLWVDDLSQLAKLESKALQALRLIELACDQRFINSSQLLVLFVRLIVPTIDPPGLPHAKKLRNMGKV
jgi:hypothetical protein